MTKFFNKWTRIFHRWIALPTLIIIPWMLIMKFTSTNEQHLPPQIEQFQSILMLLLTISGTYLYLAFAEEPLVVNVGGSIPATAR